MAVGDGVGAGVSTAGVAVAVGDGVGADVSTAGVAVAVGDGVGVGEGSEVHPTNAANTSVKKTTASRDFGLAFIQFTSRYPFYSRERQPTRERSHRQRARLEQ